MAVFPVVPDLFGAHRHAHEQDRQETHRAAEHAFTGIGLLVPMISYTLPVGLSAFALLGIGNTLLQVALNPLLTNVVRTTG